MDENIDWELLLRYISNETNAEEDRKINEWLAKEPNNEKIKELLLLYTSTSIKDLENTNLQEAWSRLTKKIGISLPFEEANNQTIRKRETSFASYKSKRYAKFKFNRISYATLIIFSFLFLSILYFTSNNSLSTEQKSVELKKITVKLGSQAKITLSDKTTIKLDAGSELSYPKKFTGDTREVYLKGEGYFEISHNPQKPFIVHINNSYIKVLGTKFNVSAWPKLQQIKVTVIDGIVSFNNEDNIKDKGVTITKGQMSTLRKNSTPTKPTKIDVKKQLGWLKQELILENTQLNVALAQLSRWNNITIQLPDPIYNTVKITGEFKKKSVDQILKNIALMIDLKIKRVNDKYVFYY